MERIGGPQDSFDARSLGEDAPNVDPDPFSIGLGLIAVLAAAGGYLEARRRRRVDEQSQRTEFRAAWFRARRSLIFFQQALSEFETYVLEEGFGRRSFGIGSIRLELDAGRHQALRRLHGQTMTTANFAADNFDELSNFLGPDDQETVNRVTTSLAGIGFPNDYRGVVAMSREALALFTELLDDIGDRERFHE